MRVAAGFAEDVAENMGSPRYVVGELPEHDFQDEAFEIALCFHFLFLYSDHLDAGFHLSSILELLRVAREVRKFPLLNIMHMPYPHLDGVLQELNAKGYDTEIHQVEYEFQKGGNQMLSIKNPDNKAIQTDVFGAAGL